MTLQSISAIFFAKLVSYENKTLNMQNKGEIFTQYHILRFLTPLTLTPEVKVTWVQIFHTNV